MRVSVLRCYGSARVCPPLPDLIPARGKRSPGYVKTAGGGLGHAALASRGHLCLHLWQKLRFDEVQDSKGSCDDAKWIPVRNFESVQLACPAVRRRISPHTDLREDPHPANETLPPNGQDNLLVWSVAEYQSGYPGIRC